MIDEIRQRHSADTDVESQNYKDIEELLTAINQSTVMIDQANMNTAKLRQLVALGDSQTEARFAADLETMKQSILRLQARCREAGLPED